MSTLPLIITDAGIAAAITADGQGLQLGIVEIALGSGNWVPDSTATDLDTELKRMTTFGATVLAPDRIHVTIRDDSTDVYDLREIGLVDENGDLFAIHAQASPIVSKAVDGKVLITATIPLTTVPPSSVTITGNEFDYPTFSETIAGVGRQATSSEVQSAAADRILTPEKADPWYYNPNNPPPPGVLAGTPLPWAGSVTPPGYLRMNGAELSRDTYSDLFAAIGTLWGAGDGSTTFNIPEARGEFMRFWDDGRGIDSGRALGTWQEAQDAFYAASSSWSDAGGNYNSELEWGHMHSDRINLPGSDGNSSTYNSSTVLYRDLNKHRSRNIAFMGIIKY
ncbi:hypothetical protein R50073_24480 [Maricurvus nonylphenolicus]|uniref:tail fiber protein n=1 Tax=Maricurvus nonylphenolicus TaxID=1008307 RepID=UPI0036F21BAD